MPDPGLDERPAPFRRNTRTAALAGASLAATVAIAWFAKDLYRFPPRSPLWLLAWAGLYLLLARGVRLMGRDARVRAWSLGLGAALGATTVLGATLGADWSTARLAASWGLVLRALFWMAGAGAGLAALAAIALTWSLRPRFADGSQDWALFGWNRRSFFLTWALIVLCWIPVIVAMLPGNLTVDSVVQLKQATGVLSLTNHHPVAHTLLIALFARAGGAAGSLTAGILAFTICQVLALSAVFAFAVTYLARRGVNRFIRLGVLAFFALVPVHALYSVTMWKDIVFSGIALLTCIVLIETALNPARRLMSWKWLTLLGLLLLGYSVFRNNGIYAVLIFFVAAIVLLRTWWRQVAALAAAVIIAYGGYSAFISGVLHAQSVSKEAMSVPLQQIARVVAERGDSLTASERQQIATFMPLAKTARAYDPSISDPVKRLSFGRAVERHPATFAKLWLKLGAEYPGVFADSLLDGSFGYWYPDIDRPVGRYLGVAKARLDGLDVHAVTVIPGYGPKQVDQYVSWFGTIPLAGLLQSPALGFWVLLVAGAIASLKYRGRLWLAVALPLALWLTTLASPVFGEFRYVYGVSVCAPVILAVSLSIKKGASHEEAVGQRHRTLE